MFISNVLRAKTEVSRNDSETIEKERRLYSADHCYGVARESNLAPGYGPKDDTYFVVLSLFFGFEGYAVRTISGLAGALAVWEDLCWGFQIEHWMDTMLGRPSPFDLEGGLKNWRNFRRFLLGIQERRAELEDGQITDVVNPYLCPSGTEMDVMIGAVPFSMSLWSIYRREYTLSSGVTEQLLSTDVAGLRWCDLLFPFRSFCLTFEQGVMFGTETFRTIVVGQYRRDETGARNVLLHCLTDSCDRYVPVSRKDREFVARRQKAGRCEEPLIRTVMGAIARATKALHGCVLTVDIGELVNGSARVRSKLYGDTGAVDGLAVTEGLTRTVANFCRYLDAGAKRGSHPSDWIGPSHPGRPDVFSVCSPEYVMYVRTRFTVPVVAPTNPLPAPQPETIEKRELCWHYRKEHMRRAPRTPIDAPKTIPVRRAEVRKDRKLDGTLPGGATGTAL